KCLTPNFEKAECISLNSCNTLLNALKNPTKSVTDFISKSRCGSVNAVEQMVCCGNLSDYHDDTILSDRRFCGYQHSDDYGSTARSFNISINEFPWVVALLYKNATIGNDSKPVSVCSGTLLNLEYVITAGQCLSIPNFHLIGVRLGEYDFRTKKDCIKIGQHQDCTESLDFGIGETFLHEQYNERTGVNDIALIKLSSFAVEYTDFLRPICLPIASIKTANIGDDLVTSGWGSTKHNAELASVKKKIFTKLMSNEDCIKDYKNTRRLITKNQMCTKDSSDNVEFSCRGDAGAPVMFGNKYQWHLEGISSGGAECGGTYPEVHTRVKNYIPWILRHIKSDLQKKN
ncbi:hypothetical protein ILUMI_07061, partial [Ignelater luminosus]